MARLCFVAGVLVGAAALRLLAGPGLVNYDTLYTLVWGRQLGHGTLPDLEVAIAPTPHPLANLGATLLSPLSSLELGGLHGELAAATVVALAYVSLALLGWVVFALGREWFNTAAGVLAALIVLTRVPVLDFGARAYIDIPFLVLVLGALLVETRTPRSGGPVLGLLGLAGLLRPEAWLFSAAYLVWLWIGGVRDPRLWALAAAAPVLWALSDLVVTGDALHSLTGTRDTAQRLDRITGLGEVPLTAPRRLGEILREPVLFGAAGGGLLALTFLRSRVALGAAAGIVAMAAFCVLAGAGLPILGRYLLLPATLLAIFAGAGAFGWAELPRGHPWRRRWAWFGAVTLLGLLAFAAPQAGRIGALRDALRIQDAIQGDLHALTPKMRCPPVTVPNHRPVPLLALWLDAPPARIAVAQEHPPRAGSYVLPSSPRVAREYILDPRDVDQSIPPPPPGFRPLGANASWRLFARACG
ncbi:MAG: hypothetical protein QOI62_2456 [Solirubrobacteraceae bacterium]|nr:hypothetical protein [Solirubrobacteraceae bacterium]